VWLVRNLPIAPLMSSSSGEVSAATAWLWEDTTIYNGDSTITPDIFVIVGGQLTDLSGVNSIDQAMAVTRSELAGLTTETSIALIGIPPLRWVTPSVVPSLSVCSDRQRHKMSSLPTNCIITPKLLDPAVDYPAPSGDAVPNWKLALAKRHRGAR
jgi:hypothetical protein